MLEGLRIMCLFTFYIVGYLAGIAVKSYYSHNRRHVKVLYHMKDSCTMCTACMSGYILSRGKTVMFLYRIILYASALCIPSFLLEVGGSDCLGEAPENSAIA